MRKFEFAKSAKSDTAVLHMKGSPIHTPPHIGTQQEENLISQKHNSSVMKLLRQRELNYNVYRCLDNLPLQIRQMSCISDMFHPARGIDKNMRKPENKRIRRERDRIRTEIAKQVDTWMTSSPVTSKFLLPSKTVSENVFKRQKGYRLGEFSDQTNDLKNVSSSKKETETNIGDDQLLIQKHTLDMNASIGSPTNQAKSPETRYNLITGFRKHYKVGKAKGAHEEPLRRYKNSRYLFHRSVHDEIEFQKRYRRLFDLNKHLQFVNSNLVSGKNINERLPPIENRDKSGSTGNFGMFEINSVQKHNEPGPIINDYSDFDDSDSSEDITPFENRRMNSPASSTNLTRYRKLPDIPLAKQSSSSPISAVSNVDEYAKLKYLPNRSKRNCKQSTDPCFSPKSNIDNKRLNEELLGTCDDSGIGERTVTQTTQASECEPYPEMKVSVNIKFKPEVNKETENANQGCGRKTGISRDFGGYYDFLHTTEDDVVDKMSAFLPKLKVDDSGLTNRTSIRHISE